MLGIGAEPIQNQWGTNVGTLVAMARQTYTCSTHWGEDFLRHSPMQHGTRDLSGNAVYQAATSPPRVRLTSAVAATIGLMWLAAEMLEHQSVAHSLVICPVGRSTRSPSRRDTLTSVRADVLSITAWKQRHPLQTHYPSHRPRHERRSLLYIDLQLQRECFEEIERCGACIPSATVILMVACPT